MLPTNLNNFSMSRRRRGLYSKSNSPSSQILSSLTLATESFLVICDNFVVCKISAARAGEADLARGSAEEEEEKVFATSVTG